MDHGYKTYTVEEATRKLEHYCAYQDRCHEEAMQKLRTLKMIPQAIDAIMGHLIEHNFINEERFARSFARGKFRIKHWGRRRIVQELKFKGISKYNIDAALKEIPDGDYLDAFDALAQKQWEGSLERNILKKKKKITDYLLRKGFETPMVADKISELSNKK
jgi:regulatory protein